MVVTDLKICRTDFYIGATVLLCADRNWFESKEECETASRSDPISAHPDELCVARRPRSCQRSTRERPRAGALLGLGPSAPLAPLPRALSRGPGLLPLAPLLHSWPCWANLGFWVHSWPLWAIWAHSALLQQGCGDDPASDEDWSCLGLSGLGSCLSLPGYCQRCSHMPLPCGM